MILKIYLLNKYVTVFLVAMTTNNSFPIEVSPNGGICLGSKFVCDGYRYNVPFRVQSHIHDDHMNGWSNSKGYQEIFMTPPTFALLVAELNADLSIRQNLHQLEIGEWHNVDSCKIRLESSCHMLGAAQVCIELESGTRVGYSGDFAWPLNDPIEVDALVLDSTNGSPRKVRQYDESEADEAFAELLFAQIKHGSVYLKAHRGTMHRALQVMSIERELPILASKKRKREIEVFRKFGFPIPNVVDRKTKEGVELAKSTHCVHLYSKGDGQFPDPHPSFSTIVLSAYFTNPKSPVNEYTTNSHCIAMCEHADFQGCLDYVKSTGAKHVLVDTRGGKQVELAMELTNRLGISAVPAIPEASKEWGV